MDWHEITFSEHFLVELLSLTKESTTQFKKKHPMEEKSFVKNYKKPVLPFLENKHNFKPQLNSYFIKFTHK